MNTQLANFAEQKVLIANRGEIAVRIIRCCQDLGARAIAVYAEADINSQHVQLADEAYALHGRSANESYLDIDKIIALAERSGATMVHPGYGFLSERREFADRVQQAGLIWVGPNPETIDILGDKVQARQLAQSVGAPLAQGTDHPVETVQEVIDFAQQVGPPIAIKAAFGGGGRGLKVAWDIATIGELYESAVREAEAAFGRGECFVEQYLSNPRHIEVQILADKFGKVVVLGTRDCSLQRRNQKLVEEAPAPFINEEQRQQFYQAAIDICGKAKYVGAATVEFLLSADHTIAFLEVNTRLQVEHPISEEVTGIDIVEQQMRIALGEPLTLPTYPPLRGHAFEFRINAEDPARGFLPTPGVIQQFNVPTGPGIRIDSGVVAGSNVPGEFDSLLAKLIVYGATREQALCRARRALREFKITGVASVLPFHQAIVNSEAFHQNFSVHTRWIETQSELQLTAQPPVRAKNNAPLEHFCVEIDGQQHDLGLPTALFKCLSIGAEVDEARVDPALSKPDNQVVSPMAGMLHSWSVTDGDWVEADQVIGIVEAMKMELQLIAPRSGYFKAQQPAGAMLQAEQVLATLE